MLKKSVLLMSVVAAGAILGSGAEAGRQRSPIPQVAGQVKLDQCKGLPKKIREQLEEVRKSDEKVAAQRQREKKEKQRDAQRWSDFLMKVSTVNPYPQSGR